MAQGEGARVAGETKAGSYLHAGAPVFGIAFLSSATTLFPYEPYVTLDKLAPEQFRTPHWLSKEMEAALPAIRFALLFPATYSETVHAGLAGFGYLLKSILPLNLLLMPWPGMTEPALTSVLTNNPPFCWLAPSEIIPSLASHLSSLGLPTTCYSTETLGRDVLERIWADAYGAAPDKHLGDPRSPYCSDAMRQDRGLSLSTARLAQRVSYTFPHDWRLPSAAISVENVLDFRVRVLAANRVLMAAEAPRDPETFFRNAIKDEAPKLFMPVALAVPGEPPANGKIATLVGASDYVGPEAIARRDLALSVLSTHHAIGRSGLALQTPDVRPELFSRLADLERMYGGPIRRPKRVWEVLRDLSDRASYLFEAEELQIALSRTSSLQVFSDFPLGILIPPGASAPLHMCVPTAYQPLTPLTRTFSQELFSPFRANLTGGLRVLLAECLDADDPIADASELGLRQIEEDLNQSAVCEARYLRIGAEAELAAAVSEYEPNVLILSAHGVYSGNACSLVIGKQRCMLDEIEVLCPVVFLSACTTAARGLGAVSVADLLLRKAGVRAVLGTLVPIRVDRNALLMRRILLYMAQAISGEEKLYTLDQALHKAIVLNAIHDMETGSRRLFDWLHSRHPATGRDMINEFKHVRAVGRLQYKHVYETTETLILEIAKETGDEKWLANHFASTGYLRESAFYVAIGKPDEVVLHAFRELEDERRLAAPGQRLPDGSQVG